jgi:hypothetical protein
VPKQSSQTLRSASSPDAAGRWAYDVFSVSLAVGLVLLALLAALVVWATPRRLDDLFISLAGGRDVLAGKLGRPDDWSFVTGTRIWIDQNWLSHLLIFLAWRIGGPTGLLILKAALIAALEVFLCLLNLRRGCPWPVAVLLAAALVMCCFQFIDLRPNLLTLVLVPLVMWLLHRAMDNRHRVWWVLPVMLAWANLHGGFVFGLGMVGLWAICISIQDWRCDRRIPLDTDWPLWACAGACIVAAGISPFGVGNLTHPLVIASSKVWRQVEEWKPLLAPSSMAAPWPFFVVLALAVVLAVLRLAGVVFARPARRPDITFLPSGPLAFDIALVVIAVLMALNSRRFVPLATLALAGPLASSFAWLADRAYRMMIVAMSAGALALLAALAYGDFIFYSPQNPVHVGTSIFERMHCLPEKFPVGAAQFLLANHVAGNAFCAWGWEGYLHWICPQVKVFIGGRAQQVYPEEILLAWRGIDPKRVVECFRRWKVELAILPPWDPQNKALTSALLASGRWACIYGDSSTLILADIQANGPLVEQALEGQLSYSSEAIGALSRTLCTATTSARQEPARVLAAATQAIAAAPSPQAYSIVGKLGRLPAFRAAVTDYLQEESLRLLRLPRTPANRLAILLCRLETQSALAALYRDAAMPDAARAAQVQADTLTAELLALRTAWD